MHSVFSPVSLLHVTRFPLNVQIYGCKKSSLWCGMDGKKGKDGMKAETFSAFHSQLQLKTDVCKLQYVWRNMWATKTNRLPPQKQWDDLLQGGAAACPLWQTLGSSGFYPFHVCRSAWQDFIIRQWVHRHLWACLFFVFFWSLGLVHWYYSTPTTPCVRNRVIQAPDSIYPKLTSMFVTAVVIKRITVKSQSKFFKHIKLWFKFKHETNRKDLPPQCFTKWQLFTELRASKN